MKAPSFWTSRSPAEQRVIGVAGAVLAAILVATFAWLPLERSRARATADLPALRASIASLERQAAEVKRLRSLPAPGRAAPSPLGGLAGTHPLAGAQVAALDDKRVRVNGSDVAFSALLDWIAAVQASHGLRVDAARIDALPTAGRVRAELTLTRS